MINFREATDRLCAAITHYDVAHKIGVSVQSVRQARMNGNSNGNRPPPSGWEDALVQLAEKRIGESRALIDELRAD